MTDNFWKDKYPVGMQSEIDPDEYRNIQAVLKQSCERFAEKPAFSNLGKTLTYGELYQLSGEFAAYLQQHTDLQPGDRIAVQLPNLLQYPVVVFGAMRAGLRAARRDGYDAAVRLDGDGQHPPAAIAPLLAELRRGADAVQARRDPTGYRAGAGRRALAAFVRAWLAGPLGRRAADPTSGLWAFGPRALALLSEEHPRGYPEPALLLLLERRGLRVAEIPVAMRARSAGHSSLTLPRAALALWCVALSTATMPRRRPAALSHG